MMGMAGCDSDLEMRWTQFAQRILGMDKGGLWGGGGLRKVVVV